MSIENLKHRLEEKVSGHSVVEVTYTKFVKPQRLLKTLSVIEQKFDDLENGIPLDEKIFRSISKLENSGFEDLTRRDWKNLAWSLSKILPGEQEKFIFSDIGKRIVQNFQQSDKDIIGLVYFPLLYSYFSLENKDVKSKPVVWIQLRDILNTNRSGVYKDLKRPKKWMNTLVDYSEILSNSPTKLLVKKFLQEQDTSSLASELESLKMAPNSWFWDDLIQSSIQSINGMNEQDYLKIISRFLDLAEQNVLYMTDILVALLERYARTSERAKVHEVLKYLALNQWGNPQYDSSAGWNNVNADTKKMVIQWFVRADLEAFFKLFSASADVNRFNYWIKFIDKISFSQIFLGPSAFQSQQPQHKKFRDLNRGRLKKLVGSTPTNNAFMLKIENLYVIDFSDTGNACFIVNKIPYNANKLEVHRDILKPWNNLLKLSHTPGWQSRFDSKMAELGVFSDYARVNNYNSGYRKY
ncbi:EH signature domain-containing protein [Acinetobacter lwoffii]|uniref:EH signature domain-containing protein n=1 Tax=Acinetobacter lwoffii TaxID=28090 RepID=UPI002096E4FC|nr:EH signature domain-containing protein [Acinetobacter lwoffii]MCO8069363.1 EH signature domain-containing protein [Acinetobacter lwoffii]